MQDIIRFDPEDYPDWEIYTEEDRARIVESFVLQEDNRAMSNLEAVQKETIASRVEEVQEEIETVVPLSEESAQPIEEEDKPEILQITSAETVVFSKPVEE